MLHTILHGSRVMMLTPFAFLLAVLFLPILIVSDNIPLFQSFVEYLYKE